MSNIFLVLFILSQLLLRDKSCFEIESASYLDKSKSQIVETWGNAYLTIPSQSQGESLYYNVECKETQNTGDVMSISFFFSDTTKCSLISTRFPIHLQESYFTYLSSKYIRSNDGVWLDIENGIEHSVGTQEPYFYVTVKRI